MLARPTGPHSGKTTSQDLAHHWAVWNRINRCLLTVKLSRLAYIESLGNFTGR